jgi:hypothetical protein
VDLGGFPVRVTSLPSAGHPLPRGWLFELMVAFAADSGLRWANWPR